MGENQTWQHFADQDVHDIRQHYLRERIQVSRKDPGARSPSLSLVSPTSAIPASWFRRLSPKMQLTVRGAAAARESRKAVLTGPWSAAQWGMWFIAPKDGTVEMALPSGYQPSKSKLPPSVRFISTKIREEEIVELDGVRTTHPLRTYMDLCRMGQRTNAWLAAGWLLHRGLGADEISSYAEEFEGPIHSNRKRLAISLPHRAAELTSFPHLLAYALLDDSPVSVRTHCELDEMGHAILLAGKDLVIAVDEDPLMRQLEADPKDKQLAQHLRKRERWVAARGFRKLYFIAEEVEADPEGFVSEVMGARHLRRRDLSY